jgi:P-type Ca2+ transporter type 2C
MKKQTNTNNYAQEITEIVKYLKTNIQTGLSQDEAGIRLKEHGPNSFEEGKRVTLFGSLIAQLKNPLIYILIAALAATLLLREFLDAGVIALAIAINAFIGVFQENRAYKAFEKLSEAQEKRATVFRGSEQMIISATELVPGDLVLIHAGMSVPADIRIVDSEEIEVNEAPLTGEAKGIHKTSKPLKKRLSITEQTNMLFMGTFVVAGHGKGLVVRTGNNTEIGLIAESLSRVENATTPVQKSLQTLAKLLARWVLVIVLFVFMLGLLQGREVSETLLIAIAIAVSILPEGLPASVTVVLAIGIERILKKGGLVKNLLAAETLGSATVILTDKTGTLTQAQMNISNLITEISIRDTLTSLSERLTLKEDEKMLLLASLRTTDAFITKNDGAQTVSGRPVEKALLEAGITYGLIDELKDPRFERISLFSFESRNKFSASLNRGIGEEILYVSGAPELILENSLFIVSQNESHKMTKETRNKFLQIIEEESTRGKRFIAIGKKQYNEEKFNVPSKENVQNFLNDITFVGLIGFEDPIRQDVREAVETAQKAGARVIMVTGDLPGTAKSIAIKAGIATKESPVMLGKETEALTDTELLEALSLIPIFSRVLPQQKLRISKVLQNDGEIVAMTGDGINDAPALRGASIGIAVESGTEVAKEASDLILLKNSFAIIVSAIEEGRRIITNLKKIVAYLLSTNLGECIAIVGSIIIALPVTLLPAQILWVNIIGGGLLNFALAFEPSEKGSMTQRPQKTGKNGVLTKRVWELTLIVGITTGIVLLSLYAFLVNSGMAIEKVRTIMFITLSLGTTLYAFSFKNFNLPLFRINPFSNPYLLISAFIHVGLIYVSISFAPFQRLLSLAPVESSIVFIAVATGFLNLGLIEIGKVVLLSRRKRNGAV